jgi:serine O-acetyltransferase
LVSVVRDVPVVNILKTLMFGSKGQVVSLYVRAMMACKARGWWTLCYRLSYRLERCHNVHISPRTEFEADLLLPHPVSIVIGESVRLGRNVTIFQGVTIGSARSGDVAQGLQPVLGDNCTVFAGAVVLGGIRVGDNVTIGANAVVIRDVPDDCTVVGAPARIIRTSLVPAVAAPRDDTDDRADPAQQEPPDLAQAARANLS